MKLRKANRLNRGECDVLEVISIAPILSAEGDIRCLPRRSAPLPEKTGRPIFADAPRGVALFTTNVPIAGTSTAWTMRKPESTKDYKNTVIIY